MPGVATVIAPAVSGATGNAKPTESIFLIPAADAAARRYPASEWIVANADRFLPYADHSFSLLLSITARMNTGEFRRVRQRWTFAVAVPAPEDLS